MQLKIKTSDK